MLPKTLSGLICHANGIAGFFELVEQEGSRRRSIGLDVNGDHQL